MNEKVARALSIGVISVAATVAITVVACVMKSNLSIWIGAIIAIGAVICSNSVHDHDPK